MSWPREQLAGADGSDRPTKYRVAVEDALCTGLSPRILFGGWALGAAAEAAQVATGKGLRSLAVSFTTAVAAGDLLDLDVTAVRDGRQVSHTRVDARVGERLTFTALATLASAAGSSSSWEPMPSVPPPDACTPRTYRGVAKGGLTELLDVRLVNREVSVDKPGDGSALLWGQVSAEISPEARLAVLSDHVPYLAMRIVPGIATTTTVSAGLRIVGELRSEWTLLRVRIAGRDREYCAGAVEMWDAAGHLVAIAEQTTRTTIEEATPR